MERAHLLQLFGPVGYATSFNLAVNDPDPAIFFLFGSTSRHVTGRKCRLKLTVQDAKKKKGERVSVTAQSTFIP
jgi:hypothetical protein